MVEPQALPANVLTMRSRALIALDGEEEEAQLVYRTRPTGRGAGYRCCRRWHGAARLPRGRRNPVGGGRRPHLHQIAGSSTSPRRRGIITCNARAHAAERDLHARRSSDAEQHPRTYHEKASSARDLALDATPPHMPWKRMRPCERDSQGRRLFTLAYGRSDHPSWSRCRCSQ